MPIDAPTWGQSTETPTWENSTDVPTWEDSQPAPPVVLTPENFQLTGPQFHQPSGLETTTDLTRAVAEDPAGFVKSLPATAMAIATAPGKLAYYAAADLRALDDPEARGEYGGNLAALQRGETPPVEKFLGAVSQTNPNLAVAAKVGKSLAEMSPLGAMGMLPAWASRLGAAGFSASMIAAAPTLFEDYATEINKPEAEQDADKLSTLKSDILQTFTFAPLAGAHGGAKWIEDIGVGLDNARRLTSDSPKPKVQRPKSETPEARRLETSDVSLQTVPPERAPTWEESTPEPLPTELDYGQGGEMPRETSKFTEEPGTPSEPIKPPVVGAAPVAPGTVPKTPNTKNQTPILPATNPKAFERGAIHINLRGGELDSTRPLTGWVLPADLADNPNTMATRYGKAGLTAIFIPREWVSESKTEPSKIKAGYYPKPQHIAVIPPEAIRPSGTVDWGKVFKAKSEQTPKKVETPGQAEVSPEVLAMLDVPVPDVAAARQRLKTLEEYRQPLQTEYARLKAEYDRIGGIILKTKGTKWERGKIKASARGKDVANYRSLGASMAEIDKRASVLMEEGRPDQRLIDSAVDAEIISDPKQTLLRRLDRRVRMLEPNPPPALVAARDAEIAKAIREIHPDATPAEIKSLGLEVQREVYFGNKLKPAFEGTNPALNIYKLREGQITAAIAKEMAPTTLFPKELQDRIANPKPTAQDVAEIKSLITSETNRIRAELEAQRVKAEADKLEEHLKEAKMMTEAQAVADSAGRPGIAGGRTAKEVKTDLVARIKTAVDKMVADDKVKLSQREDGTWLAEAESGGFALGEIEPTPGGKFKVTTWRDAKNQIRGTVATVAEAQELIKGMAAEVKGKAVIGVPGDGVYRLQRSGPALLRVWQDANGIDTSGGGGANYKTSGGAEKPPTSVKTAADWKAAKEYHGLEDLDTIFTWSPALRDVAKKVNPEKPESVTTHEVDNWIEAKRKGAEKPPSTPSSSSGTAGSPPALGGGELGQEPPRRPPPANDPRHSVFDAVPMEMPEAVRMVKALTGLYPMIREKLGRAAGLFRFTQGEAGKGRVELKASIFDLLDANDKAKLRQEATNYAEATGGTEREKAGIAEERYKFLLDQAYEEAKTRNPKQAMKVIWHEIGHVVDWLPDHIIRGRGNFFGRIASLQNYLKGVLPLDPKRIGPFQEKPTPAEKAQIRKDAYASMQAELGPMREIVETILVEEPIYRDSGITADMVKRLFGMDARETMPELYKWFAEQDATVKKAVVKAAMKGLVDDRLKNVAGREQVGTRTVEKEIRQRSGRNPTPAEVEARFKELFRAELERRNIAELASVKGELEPLIAWWRGTEKMDPYFKTSDEMYAEAFSIFANNPAALEARAPTYAKLLWNYLDRKPEVKALYDQIQADIKSGNIMPGRVKALWEMWDTNDARSLVIARDSLKTRGRDVLDNVQYHFDRRFGPIYRAARGTEHQGRIAEVVGNFLYRMSEHERYLAGLNEGVGKLLVKHNLDWSHDLGEYLFHKRIETERFNLANPLGWTSKNSLERMAEMKATLGPERFAALESAAREYRAQYEKFVVAELNAANMFSPELQAAIQERAHYATFAAVKGIPDAGIERMIETRYGASVTPHIFRQIGNAGEIKNPATATVLKGLSLISSAYRNTMKKAVVQMLQATHPEDIAPAKTRWNGKAREAVIVDNHPTVGTVVYLDQGETKAFYVRRVVSDAVNSQSGADNLAYGLLLSATGWQKALFTQLNYGFWPVNFVRDTMGWMMQMPGGATPLHWVKNLPRALVAARQSVTHSSPNPWADAALRRKMLISKGDPRGVWAASDNEFEVKLASFGMDPVQWKGQHDAVHRVVKAWDFYKNLGQTAERVNKISGMLYLDEKFPSLPEWKKREIVRERGGSPNFLERGASNPAVDLLFLFYNPWKEGVRSVMKSAKEAPWSFAAKTTTAVLMPTILQSAAVNGWLGKEREEQYKSIPDFDLTNYLVVPLGWVDRKQKKVAYLRLPLWEPARIAHGTLFQSLTDRGQGVTAHAGGQLPGLNPLWKVGLAWSQYALGKNPVDTQRGVNVMTDKTFAAGGPATAAEMAKYSWNELGGSILYRFKNLNLEAPAESEGEKLLAAPGINNALGRWVKVSDRGLADQQRKISQGVGKEHAEVQLGVDEVMRRMTGNGSWEALQAAMAAGDQNALQAAVTAAQLTLAERMLMREPAAQKYFATKFGELVMSKMNPNARMWFNAKSNEERARLIQKGLIQPSNVPAEVK